VRVAVPRPGERIDVDDPPKVDHWWREVAGIAQRQRPDLANVIELAEQAERDRRDLVDPLGDEAPVD
jgi:hypothetical protein